MLNSEMQNYLGYDKNQHSNSDNARNGISSKKLITQQGKIEIDVPRDRNSNFNPVIVAKKTKKIWRFWSTSSFFICKRYDIIRY